MKNTTSQPPADQLPALAPAPCWAPSSDMECLARLLAERGFRLSRGTWRLRDGETVPTVCIDRPDQPGWGQKWAPWYAQKQHATDAAGEAQAALALAGEAIAKWEMDAWDFPLSNAGSEPRPCNLPQTSTLNEN